VKATNYKITKEYAILAYFEPVAYSGSNYATPEQVLQGVVAHRLSGEKCSFFGRCGRTGGEPPSDQRSI
jgi:hypothetical protein